MKVEALKKDDLVKYCVSKGICKEKENFTKVQLISKVYGYRKMQVDSAKKDGTDTELLKIKINHLADEYKSLLATKINSRKEEMKEDDNSHYLIYQVLGISHEEGGLIDIYQNTGRFLYKYAGSFLEEVASLCLFFSNTAGGKTLVENTEGKRPKTFEIDFLKDNDAIEIKWRDATTDGDHITKEHTRVKVIKGHGYNPIRVMFYYPQREQAIRIQETLKTLYNGVSGEYYAGDEAWDYITKVSGYDLKLILMEIVDKRASESESNQ